MAGEIDGNIGEWNLNDISKVEADPVPIIDPGVGTPTVLRHFFFKAAPRPKYERAPTKLEILNQFKQMIEISLWSDGLIIREDRPVEVHTRSKVKSISKSLWLKMKEEGADFVILCLAEPRTGQTVDDFIHKVGVNHG